MTTRVRWLGHAALALETAGHRLLIDPFFTGNPAAVITANMAQADFILVSHGHGDHIGDTIAIAKRTGATVICNYEIYDWLHKQGLTKVHPQQHGGGFEHKFGRVKLTLAFHGSMLPDGANGGNPCGFLIYTKDGKKIYAQKLLDETLAKHKEVVIMAMHVTPPGKTDNIIIASNIGRIGKKADEDDMRVIETGKPNLEVNKKGDHFEVELVMQDQTGKTIGAVGIVFLYEKGKEAEFQKKAEQIRNEMKEKTPAIAKLFERAD